MPRTGSPPPQISTPRPGNPPPSRATCLDPGLLKSLALQPGAGPYLARILECGPTPVYGEDPSSQVQSILQKRAEVSEILSY